MVLWFGYYVPGATLWIDEDSFFVYPGDGSQSFSYTVDTNRFNFPERGPGRYSLGAALFFPDRFGQGESQASHFLTVNFSE